LEKAGLETSTGQGQYQAQRLMEAYIKYITTGIPYVTAKFAMSLDGKIATHTGDSKWITNNLSRTFSHSLRSRNDAVLTGINTVLVDNPQLTARDSEGRAFASQPVRVIVDTYAQTPLDAIVLSEPGKTMIAVGENTSGQSKENLKDKGAELLELPVVNGFIDLEILLKELGRRQISSLMVEGGAAIMGSLFDQNLIDKVIAFVAPVIIGGEKAKTPVGGLGVEEIADALRLDHVSVERFETDVMISGYIKK
jgi:diaminohydroxyphosphoribosylaminopyrimidine deaminase/5-amino-6-(5-phosphoribosylamino)uracil reductase